MGKLFHKDVTDVQSMKALAHVHHFALWDVYASLIRKENNSSDTNLSELVPNDIDKLLHKYPKIRHVFCTGRKAYDGLNKHFKELDIPVTLLPSTSPAYAAMRFEEKLARFDIIKETLERDT